MLEDRAETAEEAGIRTRRQKRKKGEVGGVVANLKGGVLGSWRLLPVLLLLRLLLLLLLLSLVVNTVANMEFMTVTTTILLPAIGCVLGG